MAVLVEEERGVLLQVVGLGTQAKAIMVVEEVGLFLTVIPIEPVVVVVLVR
jgi:hypothetical protein